MICNIYELKKGVKLENERNVARIQKDYKFRDTGKETLIKDR